MLLALRINVLAKGYSGISLETLEQVIKVFNGTKMFKENLPFPFFFLTVLLKGVAQWVRLQMLVFQLGSCERSGLELGCTSSQLETIALLKDMG